MMLDSWNTKIQYQNIFLMNRIANWANDQFHEENIDTFRARWDDDPLEATGIVVCSGIYPHKDEGNAKFSHLLVLRNDGFCVGYRRHSVGEALILNIHEEHECLWPGTREKPSGNERWIALFCDSHTRLPRTKAEAKFLNYIYNF